jgi:hypothetical protein
MLISSNKSIVEYKYFLPRTRLALYGYLKATIIVLLCSLLLPPYLGVVISAAPPASLLFAFAYSHKRFASIFFSLCCLLYIIDYIETTTNLPIFLLINAGMNPVSSFRILLIPFLSCVGAFLISKNLARILRGVLLKVCKWLSRCFVA